MEAVSYAVTEALCTVHVRIRATHIRSSQALHLGAYLLARQRPLHTGRAGRAWAEFIHIFAFNSKLPYSTTYSEGIGLPFQPHEPALDQLLKWLAPMLSCIQ